MYKIPLSYNPIDSVALSEILAQYKNFPHSQLINDFEKILAEILGVKYVVALSSGTAGIHLALRLLGIGEGDFVPVPTFTYVGSVNPIFYQNAKPIFIDSEAETWNMDPELLRECLVRLSAEGTLPKVIIVVHGYGMPAKMHEILEVAKEFGLTVIEDAASGLGGFYRGKPLGTLGDIGVFSFNSNKTVTTYGGGALITQNKDLYERALFLATQALSNKPYYFHETVGYNYRMGPLNAAYGIIQLKNLEKLIARRIEIFEYYRSHISVSGTVSESKESKSSHWLSTVLLHKNLIPLDIKDKLAQKSIETRLLWNPMHLQPAFKGVPYFTSGVSESLFERGLCLPSGSGLTQEDLSRVAEIIIKST